MLFRIINPSDSYTVEAPDLALAAVVALLLGKGQYQFQSLDGGEDVPMFAFMGSEEVNQWFEKHAGNKAEVATKQTLDTRLIEIADCLDSVVIGQPTERAPYLEELAKITDPEAREHFWFEHHDKRRSSLNDIGGYAHKLAANFRKQAANAA